MAIPTLKSGNLRLEGLSVSNTATPGQAVRYEVEVINGANAITPWDADDCADPVGPAGRGYEIEVIVIRPNGEEEIAFSGCLGFQAIGLYDRVFSGSFSAPQETGDHNVRAYMRLPGSENSSSSVSDSVTVTDEGSADPPPDPGNGDEDDNDGDGDDDGAFNAIVDAALDRPLRTGAVAIGASFLIRQIVGD